jgi:hypothetical protein
MPTAPRSLYRSELVGEYTGTVWLLEIAWAGRVYRWSSTPIQVDDAAGQGRWFPGGLDPIEVEDDIDLEGEAEERSVSLELVFPVNVAALIERGFRLASATGELSLVVEGSAWEAREVVVKGLVSAPEYDEQDIPIALTIEERPFDDTAAFPPPGLRVTPTTYADALSDDYGRPYPWVFGRPGRYTDSTGAAADIPGTSAPSTAPTPPPSWRPTG